MKESDIPPIKGNPRLGKETSRDASVMYGGARSSKGARSTAKKPVRRGSQQNFAISNKAQLKKLVEMLGINATAVVNLALARLAKEYL